MNSNSGEFVTSFTSKWGDHPFIWFPLSILLAFMLGAGLFFFINKKIPERFQTATMIIGSCVFSVLYCFMLVSSLNDTFDQGDAEHPRVSTVAKHYGLHEDPDFKKANIDYSNSSSEIWVNAKGNRFTQCTVLSHNIDSHHFAHKLSCLKVGDNDKVLFPAQ